MVGVAQRSGGMILALGVRGPVFMSWLSPLRAFRTHRPFLSSITRTKIASRCYYSHVMSTNSLAQLSVWKWTSLVLLPNKGIRLSLLTRAFYTRSWMLEIDCWCLCTLPRIGLRLMDGCGKEPKIVLQYVSEKYFKSQVSLGVFSCP